MSRSGYADDGELSNWDMIKWRGAVASAIRGKRGQTFLRELLEALDEMPSKRLIADEMIQEGEVCALGAVGVKRALPGLADIEPYDQKTVSATFGIAQALVAEIMYVNDDGGPYWVDRTPEWRWKHVRDWAEKNLTP